MAISFRDARAITDEAAVDGISTELIDARQTVFRREGDETRAPGVEERIGGDKERASARVNIGGRTKQKPRDIGDASSLLTPRLLLLSPDEP